VDTNSFIYTVELVAPYQALVKPLQARDITLETQYRAILVSSPEVRLYPISRAVLERAARLRATAQLKTPDALHAATAPEADCTLFVTNDAAFRRVSGLMVVVLHDVLAP
jgi:predicted nucleic acid-binding protein